MSHPRIRKILLAGGLLVLMSSATVAYSLFAPAGRAPEIQGTLIPEGRPLADFTLIDHQGREFQREDLLGQWHLVSYGYTYCPDMCPMTLMTVEKVLSRIQAEGEYADLEVLFYSVDSERDTPEQLASYAPKIHPDFVGLTRGENEKLTDNAFERSLGLVSRIDQSEQQENPESYNVSHGVQLYLINPRGELQAVFDSKINRHNIYEFSKEQLYSDYRAVRQYLGDRPHSG